MERLLDAAEDLLGEKSFESITVQEIARRAGVTTGALYARFGGKAGLLRGLEARLHAAFGAGLGEELDAVRWAQDPLWSLFSDLVARMLAGYRSRPALVRALALEERRDAGAAERAREFNRAKFREPLTGVLRRRSDIGRPDREESIEFALFLLASALTGYALFPEADPIGPRISDAGFADHLADALTHYLQGDGPSGRPGR
jgi:AcrR family transcriptional regulator